MQIKSLYTRIVLVFVGNVMLSLFVAFIATNWLYNDRIHQLMEDILITSGKKMIHAFESTPYAEVVPFMQNLSGLYGSVIQLYNEEDQPLLDKEASIQVKRNYIDYVLSGKTATNIPMGKSMYPIIGLPIEHQGKAFALFLTLEHNSIDKEMMNSIHLMYVLILFVVSLLILVAARYIVNPIVRLTEATKRMAKGKFDVVLPSKRKDEIGVLSASFNEMARELAKLDQMRQEFVTNVSHEIQSPLTSISGFSKALKQKKMSEENRLKYLTIIEEESERLSRLSRNLLKLSSLQQGQTMVQSNPYRLDEQLRKVVIGLEPQWTEKEIEIDLELEPVTIKADEDQMNQVWTNLLNNSIKFSPIQGKIGIAAKKKAESIVVTISDNGIGIPEEQRSDIFKPFHKVDKSRDASIKGNGLGLSIVKQIVEHHHGNIEVSGAAGKGAIFTVTLPD